MKSRFVSLCLLPLLLIAGLVGCASDTRPRTRSGPVKAVATFSVIGEFVKQVGGDKVELLTLVGPDNDAHTFSPAPTDGVALSKADIVFENGIQFENWMNKLFTASRSRAQRVVVTQGMKLIAMADGDGHDHKHDHKHGHEGHNHGENDPHVWHDVANAIHMVGVIRDALAKADPANAATYTANADAYIAQLKELDKWVVAQVATIPANNCKLVTTHDTFGYFSKRYGFTVVGTALGSMSTEAADPSAKAFGKLCDEIKAAKVPAIFAENVSNPKLIDRMAKEAGVKVGTPLFTDALGKPGTEGDTYPKMIRHNVTAIVSALKS